MLPTIKTVLFPTDIGPQAINVLKYAEALATAHGAEIVLLHVIEPLPHHALSVINEYMAEDAARALRESGIAELRHDVERQLLDFLREESTSGQSEGLAMPTVRIVEGAPAASILDEAQSVGADAIVMGSHGHSTLGEIVMGSVASKVLHKAEIPVFVVPFRALDDA